MEELRDMLSEETELTLDLAGGPECCLKGRTTET